MNDGFLVSTDYATLKNGQQMSLSLTVPRDVVVPITNKTEFHISQVLNDGDALILSQIKDSHNGMQIVSNSYSFSFDQWQPVNCVVRVEKRSGQVVLSVTFYTRALFEPLHVNNPQFTITADVLVFRPPSV